MKKVIKSCALLILGAGFLFASYYFGYVRGLFFENKREVASRLHEELFLYKLAEQGETNEIKGRLRFFVFAHYDYYTNNFSENAETNKYILTDLETARVIASQERTQVVYFTKDSLIDSLNKELQTNNAVKNTNSIP